MTDRSRKSDSLIQETSKHHKEAFEFQLEILKDEIQLINQTMGRLDQMTQSIKNWMIVI